MQPYQQGAARPARDVPPGASWAFRDHKTMADVLRQERDTRTEKDTP